MLKSNELRIGNLVQKDGMIIRVEGILEPMGIINDSRNSMIWYCRELNGIPITEEWLFRFNFKKDHDWAKQLSAEYKISGSVGITVNNGVYSFWVTHDTSITVKFIHTIQNVFFALKGEELILSNENAIFFSTDNQ